MRDIDLSIYIITYNHENYIRQAIESVLMQKTNYTYEILIGEDLSTDSTRMILRELEQNNPGKLNVFYRDHNMYQEVPSNADDLRIRCRGRYIIALEGDDYWITNDKIDSQIRFLDENPEYIAVCHSCIIVDKNSLPTGECYPECKQDEYTLKHFASGILPGQLTTIMYRNYNLDNGFDASILNKGLMPWDRALYFSLASQGRIYCMNKKMSAYRLIRDEGSSYAANYVYDYDSVIRWNTELLKYAQMLENKEATKFAEAYFVRHLFGAYKAKYCNIKQVYTEFKKVKCKVRAIYMWIMSKIYRDFFHKEVFY
ncbi:MAG: glycosyltransferase family 2 protein [Lachnospiraceae bacterium]|nr:glycosyltransferase family 2 protein [Lachnospiraceae bacterium]